MPQKTLFFISSKLFSASTIIFYLIFKCKKKALARNGSFGVTGGSACVVEVKPNVPFADTQKSFKIFCAKAKKLNHET